MQLFFLFPFFLTYLSCLGFQCKQKKIGCYVLFCFCFFLKKERKLDIAVATKHRFVLLMCKYVLLYFLLVLTEDWIILSYGHIQLVTRRPSSDCCFILFMFTGPLGSLCCEFRLQRIYITMHQPSMCPAGGLQRIKKGITSWPLGLLLSVFCNRVYFRFYIVAIDGVKDQFSLKCSKRTL